MCSFQLITAACALGMNSFITTGSNMFSEIVLETLAAGLAGNVLKGREMQQRLTNAVVNVSKYGKIIIKCFFRLKILPKA